MQFLMQKYTESSARITDSLTLCIKAKHKNQINQFDKTKTVALG